MTTHVVFEGGPCNNQELRMGPYANGYNGPVILDGGRYVKTEMQIMVVDKKQWEFPIVYRWEPDVTS